MKASQTISSKFEGIGDSSQSPNRIQSRKKFKTCDVEKETLRVRCFLEIDGFIESIIHQKEKATPFANYKEFFNAWVRLVRFELEYNICICCRS